MRAPSAQILDSSRRRSDQVFEHLLDAIVTMALEPGVPVSKEDLAVQYGTSRQPVTDAIARLASLGLMSVVPQVGTSVALVSQQAVRESSIVRAGVESMVVRILADNCDRAVVTRLRGLLAQQELCVENKDFDGFTKLDELFHHSMMDDAGLPGLWDQIAAARWQLVRVRRIGLSEGIRIGEAYSEHVAIVDAIDQGNCAKAAQEVEAHIRYAETFAHRLHGKYPHFFVD